MASELGTSEPDRVSVAPSHPMSPLTPAASNHASPQVPELGDTSVKGSSPVVQRSASTMSHSQTLTPSRGGTLRKPSLNRATGSRRGSRHGNNIVFADDVAGGSQANSAFYTPVPTSGSPTDILANRFQVWRKILKDIITYFRDLQKSYDARSKSLYSLTSVLNNMNAPQGFIYQGGISDAVTSLREYHKKSISEANKAKSIEEEVVVQLTGLRSDLGQKVKEIKGLHGDFKNNVEKEIEVTRRAVHELGEALQAHHSDARGDPYLAKLNVERQLARQIEEENYLHRAFLNLESSGRELESIVVGEIQKAYTAFSGILKRESDESFDAIKNLRLGPLSIAKDLEWNTFVKEDEHFVDPRVPVRKLDHITYPGKDDPGASEIRAGTLERKSKYLKSYTPGWYVLTPSYLHEFKSPDRIWSQTPVMSLALSDQKLGSHSNSDSTSHKFMLKGRQSGGMHKSHAWVFRAESYSTLMSWFDDLKELTEKTGIERDAFIRRSHQRTMSSASHKPPSISDASALDEDEADRVPYSGTASQAEPSTDKLSERPNPGGRFPSLLNLDNRDSQDPLSPSSQSDHSADRDIVAAAGTLPGAVAPTKLPVHENSAAKADDATGGHGNGHPAGTDKPVVAVVAASSKDGDAKDPASQTNEAKAREQTAQLNGDQTTAATPDVSTTDQASVNTGPPHISTHIDSTPLLSPNGSIANPSTTGTTDTAATSEKPPLESQETGGSLTKLHVPGEFQ